jgi:hypothetical protein
MAYDARRKEVLADLEKTDHAPEAKEAIRRTLDSWFTQREGRLVNLLGLLEPSDGPRHGDWIAKAREAAAAAHDALGKSDHGKLWLARISNEEHTFFFKLMVSQVPVKRDLMVQQTKALARAEKEFEEKWKTIRDSDRGIEDRMHRIALEYDEILKSAANGAAVLEREAKEKTAETVRKSISLGLKAVTLGAVEPLIEGAARAIEIKVSEVNARRGEIQALLTREEGIFATFREARQVVEAFLRETSYPHVKDAYEVAERAAGELAGQMLTPGQKDDAAALGAAIRNELSKVFRIAEDAYKAFARKHEHLFFGPLGGGYYQELMEPDFWKERSDRWKDSKRDIDDLLRERIFVADENRVLDVSLDGLTDEDKTLIREKLGAHCRNLLRAWNSFKEVSKNPYWALESRETLRSILVAMGYR